MTGCGLRVFRFGISDLGFGIEKIDRMTCGLRVAGCGLRVAGYGLRGAGCEFLDLGLGISDWGLFRLGISKRIIFRFVIPQSAIPNPKSIYLSSVI